MGQDKRRSDRTGREDDDDRARRIIRAPVQPSVDSALNLGPLLFEERCGDNVQGPEARDDWRPARCTSEDAIGGRILISFLALFCISMVRFLYLEYRRTTAESICEELSSFSPKVMVDEGNVKRRVFSTFGKTVRRLWYGKRSVPVPKAPGQILIDGFQS
ncbi:MAG TPA: hypothetical protein DDY59_15340 [Lachnospiraceae bacterium]|nr:hypothetical protein [Lachnospiraceae bacterium]